MSPTTYFKIIEIGEVDGDIGNYRMYNNICISVIYRPLRSRIYMN